MGEFSYQGREGKETCVHAECMAQVLIQDRQREENSRTKRETLKKLKNRKEYDIGWRMDSVPKNAALAERMGSTASPQGLCCLVLDEASRTVKVQATLEPSASINLEYLLLALKVRKTAQREPLFSLDPVDPQNLEKTPQKKVAWAQRGQILVLGKILDFFPVCFGGWRPYQGLRAELAGRHQRGRCDVSGRLLFEGTCLGRV